MGYMGYFVSPKPITVTDDNFFHGHKTYSEYNYTKSSIESYLKTRHFEVALRLSRKYFQKSNVIDFGCADGPFLPSLAKHFNYVIGIEKDAAFIKIASRLCQEMCLNNVELICNDNLDIDDVKVRTGGKKCKILFLLETLEHLGNKENLYASKIVFLKELFKLIDEDGIIVMSVPKMVGLSFLIQRLGLKILGKYIEPISTKDLIKASLFNNTNELEKKWEGKHLGFNHEKLERFLMKNLYFQPYKKFNMFFQAVYVVGRKI